MTEDRPTRAVKSRKNGRGGPRTAAGKAIVSCNALRHGLAAKTKGRRSDIAAIERLAQALCEGEADESLRRQARVVAETEITLRSIDAQRQGVIERLRDRKAIALAKGDNSFAVAKGRFLEAWILKYEIGKLLPEVIERYRDELEPPFDEIDCGVVPTAVKVLIEETSSDQYFDRAYELALERIAADERDDGEAIEEAALDLVRLERYERRAWSRQKRAIYEYMNLRVAKRWAHNLQ